MIVRKLSITITETLGPGGKPMFQLEARIGGEETKELRKVAESALAAARAASKKISLTANGDEPNV